MCGRGRLSSVGVCVAACVTIACGQASFDGPGPSSVGEAGASGAVITGTVIGVAPSALTAAGNGGSSGSVTVSVAGTNIVSGLDSTGRFRLVGVPNGPIELQFTGGGLDASLRLTVAEGERIELTIRVTDSSIRIEAERREHGRDATRIEGLISELDATARTIRVAGALVEVPASAVIQRGSQTLAFADLHVGDRVDVRGALERTRIVATSVDVKHDDDDDDDDDGDDDNGDDDRDEDEDDGRLVELEGRVSGLTGACPDITFTVREMSVRANNATRYEGGACAQVQNDMPVEVTVQRQSDGPLLAVRVEIED